MGLWDSIKSTVGGIVDKGLEVAGGVVGGYFGGPAGAAVGAKVGDFVGDKLGGAISGSQKDAGAAPGDAIGINMAARAAEAELPGPATVIVGSVVTLRDKLSWFRPAEAESPGPIGIHAKSFAQPKKN